MSRGILTPINVEGYSHLYSITKNGRVWSVRSKRFIKPSFTQKYAMIQLWKDGKAKLISVHRLVALTYIPNPNHLPFVNHKDENISNNDVENLEWCTHQYNINYGGCIDRIKKSNQKYYCSERYKENARINGAKVSKKVRQFTRDGLFIKSYPSGKEASRQTKINHSHILECCSGKRKTAGNYVWQYEKAERERLS